MLERFSHELIMNHTSPTREPGTLAEAGTIRKAGT